MNRWTSKQNVVYPYNGMFSFKKGRKLWCMLSKWMNLEVKWNQPVTKRNCMIPPTPEIPRGVKFIKTESQWRRLPMAGGRRGSYCLMGWCFSSAGSISSADGWWRWFHSVGMDLTPLNCTLGNVYGGECSMHFTPMKRNWRNIRVPTLNLVGTEVGDVPSAWHASRWPTHPCVSTKSHTSQEPP